MDFIDGLPKSHGYEVILVVVDRLSKYGHFIPLKHPYTAQSVAKVFMDVIVRLHGLPDNITSDRDAVFLSTFWQELFSLQGVQLNLSSAYHPQSDGQTEVLNRCLETYLRCFCAEDAKGWYDCLPMAEFWYNTCHHSAIELTPYEALYGRPPPLHLPYLPGESSSAEVDNTLINRELKLQLLRHHLIRAQLRMKQQADKHRSDRSFAVGDWVYFKVRPYRQVTISETPHHKLAAKYYGPFQIIRKVGPVAYTLLFPDSVKIHPTVHVSLLKKCYEVPSLVTYPPTTDLANPHCSDPEAILQRRMVKKGNKAVTQVLVKWKDLSADAATWEYSNILKTRFPSFDP
uniref:1-aminocyclopropane-1-carboxylate oxidase homolog n=1 Tax=Solanum tuberosum TaxID=4113 RepID=M1BG77_SOLTU